jgi:GMP synthase (glutamine-hydrolysing)
MFEPSKPILIVKTGEPLPSVKAAHGDFEDWIARGLGMPLAEVAVAAAHQGQALPDPATIAGVVVTGSPAMVTERADWSEAAAAWLAKLVESDSLPVLGLCYGHQLLAHGLGGEVGTNPNGRETGSVEVRFRARDGDASLGPLFESGAHQGHMSHLESVLRPPADAEVLAETDQEPHAVLRFGPRQWGVQFHPEFDREIMRSYVVARREILAGEGADPDAIHAAVVETPQLTRILERFAKLVAEAAS